MAIFRGAGVTLTLQGTTTNEWTLPAGAVWYPNNQTNPSQPGQGTGRAGWFYPFLGRYTRAQVFDQITGIWRGIGDDGNTEKYVYSDGVNLRYANQSGCAVGAVVTTAGTGYTSAPTVTASAGSSKWVAVLGPNVSAITVAYGGTNYTYPPVVVIDAPPPGGVQATAYCTLSSGAVSTITVQNAGGGYTGGVPNVYLVNDARENASVGASVTAGSGATATATLANAQTVVAVLCSDHGSPITSNTVPTLTFSGGAGSSAAATVLMNWGITTYSITAAGAGYGASTNVVASAAGPAASTAAASTAGPDIGTLLVRQRNANLWVATGSGGGVSTIQILDGGVYVGLPTFALYSSTIPTTVATIALTMGGFTDTFLTPAF